MKEVKVLIEPWLVHLQGLAMAEYGGGISPLDSRLFVVGFASRLTCVKLASRTVDRHTDAPRRFAPTLMIESAVR